MKKVLKVIGIILLIIVVIAAAVAVWQRDNIKALVTGLRYSDEELGEIKVSNAENTLSDMNSQVSVELREMTEEEKQKIANGELSQTEVYAQIFAEAMASESGAEGEAAPPEGEAASPAQETQTPAAQGGEAKPAETKPQTKPEAKPQQSGKQPASAQPAQLPAKSADQLVADAVSELSSLQSSYMGRIEGAISSAKAYYDEQKKTTSKAVAKSNALSKLIGDVNSLQAQCDSEVEGILGRLSGELDARGADKSVISTIRNAYADEKETQKAAYMKKYADKM